MEEPSASEIETAKARVTRDLATPSDLFAVEPPSESSIPEARGTQPNPNQPTIIPIGELPEEIDIGRWTEHRGKSAASFIDLASRLESETQLGWARVAWERVIDSSDPDENEEQAALKGISRIRASESISLETDADTPEVLLTIKAPKDRVELTRKAAEEAAQALQLASSGLIRVTASTTPSEDETFLSISLGLENHAPSITAEAPSAPEKITESILSNCFKLIASKLATDVSLEPISNPIPGERAEHSLSTRVTRMAWEHFASKNQDVIISED